MAKIETARKVPESVHRLATPKMESVLAALDDPKTPETQNLQPTTYNPQLDSAPPAHKKAETSEKRSCSYKGRMHRSQKA